MPIFKAPGISITSITEPAPIQRQDLHLPALFVGDFAWGPVETPITITSVDDLTTTFGAPTDSNRINWMVIRDYIRTAGQIRIIRIAKPGARNAVLSKYRLFSMMVSNVVGEFQPGDYITIQDNSRNDARMPEFYPCIDVGSNTYTSDRARSRLVVVNYDSDTGQLDFAAEYKFNGTAAIPCQIVSEILSNTINKHSLLLAGDNVSAAVSNDSHDIIIPLIASRNMLEANNVNRFSINTVDVELVAANISGSINFTDIDDAVIKFTPKTGGARATAAGILSNHVCINSPENFDNLSISVNPAPLVNDPIKFIARYPGELGNSLGVLVVQPGFELTSQFAPGSIGKILRSLPKLGTSQTALSTGFTDLKDEVHVIVYDTDGAITGQAGYVIENYNSLSVLRGAKNNNADKFFIDVINRTSNWIYAIDTIYKQEGFDCDSKLRLSSEYTVAEQTLPVTTQFSTLPPVNNLPVTIDITDNVDFNLNIGDYTVSGDIAASTNATTSVYSQRALLRFTNNSDPGIFSAVIFEQPILGKFDINVEEKTGELTAETWSLSTTKTLSLTSNHSITGPSFINQNINGRIGINFPCNIQELNNGISDNSKITVKPAHIWNGLDLLRDFPDGKTVMTTSWINEDQQTGIENTNPYAFFGVSGFACDNPKLFSHRDNLENDMLGSGINGYANHTQMSARANQLISTSTAPKEIIIGGNQTIDDIKAILPAIEGSTAILFASVPNSLTLGFNTAKTAQTIVNAFADIDSQHLFVDSGWYSGFDEITGESMLIPLCGITAGMANNKEFPWSSFAGNINGVYPNVSSLVFDPQDEISRSILYSGKINPVYSSGNGIVLNGNRLATNKNTLLSRIDARRALSMIEMVIQHRVNTLLFTFGDDTGYTDIKREITDIMISFAQAGATGQFLVSVGATPQEKSQRIVNATIMLQLLESVNWIEMRIIGRYSLTNSGFTN